MLSVWQACAVTMFLKHFGLRNKAPERGPQIQLRSAAHPAKPDPRYCLGQGTNDLAKINMALVPEK